MAFGFGQINFCLNNISFTYWWGFASVLILYWLFFLDIFQGKQSMYC